MTVRELKKQLQSEKKRAEKLQEKLKTVDTDQLVPPNGLALLDVPVQVGKYEYHNVWPILYELYYIAYIIL